MKLNYNIATELEMENLGKQLAQVLLQSELLHSIIYLIGDLGAGKTTLVRGFLRGLGHQDLVKSPTFTLVEPYDFERFTVYHFDFYRLTSPLELEGMGIRDYFSPTAHCLIEWPEKGEGICPLADIEIRIEINKMSRALEVSGISPSGIQVLEKLKTGK